MAHGFSAHQMARSRTRGIGVRRSGLCCPVTRSSRLGK
jgi:hypothetical protein